MNAFLFCRYIKALEEIRRIQRDHKKKKDEEEVELKHLNANNIRAKEIKSNLVVKFHCDYFYCVCLYLLFYLFQCIFMPNL